MVPGYTAVKRVARWLGRMFVAAGAIYICAYEIPEPATGPAPLHPERVRPEVPLSAAEVGLAAQLRRVPRGIR